jgi:hypothetical protein
MNDPTLDLLFGAVLTRQHLEMALLDADVATRTRKINGLPETPAHREYGGALVKALAAAGQMDVPNSPTRTITLSCCQRWSRSGEPQPS